MKKYIFMNFFMVLFPAIFITSISGVSVFAADSLNAKLLSIAEVEKVTGIQGLKTALKDPSKHMIGDLNFVRPDGKRLLSVVFETINLKEFEKTKASSSFKTTFNGPVKGIGDEAYDGPPKMEPFILSVRKGIHWLTISTSIDVSKGMKPFLTQEQLKKIAEIIIRNGKW
jgi:hypothetical protein